MTIFLKAVSLQNFISIICKYQKWQNIHWREDISLIMKIISNRLLDKKQTIKTFRLIFYFYLMKGQQRESIRIQRGSPMLFFCCILRMYLYFHLAGFPDGSDVKESSQDAGDTGSIPGSGTSPGEGNGYPLQHFCLENPVDRVAWRVTDHGVTKNWTQLRD